MCVAEYCIVCFTHCLVYLVVFNTDSSTLGSTRFWALIVQKMCSWFFFFVILDTEGCLGCCYVILCDVCYCIELYCIAPYCIVLYFRVLNCSTLPPFAVNNNNNNNNNNKDRCLGIDVYQNHCLRHEGVQGSWSVAPRVLNRFTRWMCVISIKPWPLYSRGNNSSK